MAFLAAAAPFLALAGAAAGVAGTGIQAVGQAKSNEFNARANELEAESIEGQTAFEERQQRRRIRLLQGEAEAIGAASGIGLSSGTALLLELDRARQGELAALQTRFSGETAAFSKRIGARIERARTPFQLAGSAIEGTSILTKFIGGPSGRSLFAKVGG